MTGRVTVFVSSSHVRATAQAPTTSLARCTPSAQAHNGGQRWELLVSRRLAPLRLFTVVASPMARSFAPGSARSLRGDERVERKL